MADFENMEMEFKIEEESVEARIFGLTAEIKQMEWMIAENVKLIAEGDDVKGRTFLNTHLEKEVKNKKAEIQNLQKNI